MINHARKKQRSLVIALLDLKNGFDKVDRELNACVTAFESDDQHSQNGHYGQV